VETIQLDWTVRLCVDSPRIDLELGMVNSACDHRLRVLFPTGATTAKTFLTDSAFDVIERSIALPTDNHAYREPRVETVPFQSWVACHAEGSGLAIVAHGLREAAVADRPDRAIALTLLRSVGRTFLTNGEPDGQLRGQLNYRMSIVPLERPPNHAKLFWEAAGLAAGTRSLQLSGLKTPNAPASASAFSVEGDVVLSSLRPTETGNEVRMFNPSDVPVNGRLIFSDSSICPVSLVPVDFTLTPTNEPELTVQAGVVNIDFKPKQIRTFLFSYPPDFK
jgi:alpha-mannosidase/mannosylglycerate hydrolase